MGLFTKIFGSDNDRQLKKIYVIADKIEALADKYSAMTDKELNACTNKFKKELISGKTLDDILPDAYACVREASTRVLGLRHFYVQLVGGIILHQGRIAEMSTGEGKTLVATLPAYLNALTEKGVHVVTVNEYLAKRDADWMGKVYKFLGLTVGVIYSGQNPMEKQQAYQCDITYGTNSEFGFDYLRDSQIRSERMLSQRGLNYVIIDEVDSVLIDEARTPLIISAPRQSQAEGFYKANAFAKTLKAPKPDSEDEAEREGDFEINEEDKKIALTERGMHKAEAYFKVDNIGSFANIELYRNIRLAVRANFLMQADRDYVVKDGEIIIVDEFTGRLMVGRRFNDGLHSAIEVKEGVRIKKENSVVATITYQNLFRLYRKLSGMTGTAKTEENEFREIYGLDIVVVPTNKPIARIDEVDRLYTTLNGKYRAIIEDIKDCQTRRQPVLVGTVSVEKSEELAALLRKERINFELLNAKNHEFEAQIVAQAGRLDAVTIATNMAGRGTDIMLGGNAEFLARQFLERSRYPEKVISEAISKSKDVSAQGLKAREVYLEKLAEYKEQVAKEKEEVIKVGGLRIIGTERHESRRIDNQLRGRAGRQGDPGSSVFYLSMEDDLIRIFGGDRLKNMSQSLHLPDDVPITVNMIAKRVESAQQKIEARNYSIRKQVLTFDDVLNRQRKIIYADRYRMLLDKSKYIETMDMLSDSVENVLKSSGIVDMDYRNINYVNANRNLSRAFLLKGDVEDYLGAEFITPEQMKAFDSTEIKEKIKKRIKGFYSEKLYTALQLSEPENFDQAIELSIDFTKPVNEWNLIKLNELLTAKIKSYVGDFVPFTLADAESLQEKTAEGLANKISANFKKYFNDRYSSLFAGVIASCGLDDKQKSSSIDPNILTQLVYDEYKNDTKVFRDLTDRYVSLFAKYFAVNIKDIFGDLTKTEKTLLHRIRLSNTEGEPYLSGILSFKKLNVYATDIFADKVLERLQEVYGSLDAFEDYVKDYVGSATLKQYIAYLINQRSDPEKPCSTWDFVRINEFLSYNCLNKEQQARGLELLSSKDLDLVEKQGFIQNVLKKLADIYIRRYENVKKALSYQNVFAFFLSVPQKSMDENLTSILKEEFLAKNGFDFQGQINIDYKGSLLERVFNTKNVFDLVMEDSYDALNEAILEGLITTLKDAGLSAEEIVKELQLDVTDFEDLVKSCQKATETQIKSMRLSKQKAFEIARSIVQTLDGKEYGDVTFTSDLLDIANGLYASYVNMNTNEKEFKNVDILSGDKVKNTLFEMIDKHVDKVFAELSDENYPEWNIVEISKKLSERALPSLEREKGRNLFTKLDLRESVAEQLVVSVTPKVEKIYSQLIERDKKENNVTPHEYILKMLPDVVAGYVMDYVDYALDINSWNYEYINESLAEKLLPDGLDDENAYELVTKEIAAKNNIDDVIDAVIEKVVKAYDKKAVDYNISLIADYIEECVRLSINNKLPYSDWNYKEINNYLGRRLLLPKDFGNKQMITKELILKNLERQDYEDDEEDVDEIREVSDDFYGDGNYKKGVRLGYKTIVDVVLSNYADIVSQNIQSYDRFISILCYRKGRRGLTFGFFEKDMMLNYTDQHWRDHMDNMERLREGIGLRAYGQQDPVLSYQKEGNDLFDEMVSLVRDDVVLHALKDDVDEHFGNKQESILERKRNAKNSSHTFYKHSSDRTVRKIKEPRPNDRCPCGSGKKYKNCCMYKKNSAYNWKAIESDED